MRLHDPGSSVDGSVRADDLVSLEVFSNLLDQQATPTRSVGRDRLRERVPDFVCGDQRGRSDSQSHGDRRNALQQPDLR